jgi:hypothetical protein
VRKEFAARAAAIAAIFWVGSVPAHHSISVFDISTPIWVTGTVVSYEAINPHAIIALEERINDGTVVRWLIEGPALQRLARMDVEPDFIQAGDVIEVCGFAPKLQFSSQRPSPDTVGYPSQTIHGHVLLMPDRRMRLWGPYGKLENCIRPDDRVQTWVQFLNMDPMAQPAWCRSRSFVRVASLAPEAFVNEVGSLMADPCE